MENYSKLELDATYRVTLHKNLIEADFSRALTIVEQRIMYAVISNIPAPIFKKENGKYVLDENGEKIIENPVTELPKVKMTAKDFSDLVGLKNVDYKKLSKVSGDLMTKVITLKSIHNDDIEQMQWITYTRYVKGTGMVLIELHPRLLPYVANLTKNFSSVSLGEVTGFKCKYSSRLFFLAKNSLKLGSKTVPLDELRKIIGVGYTEKNGERVYKLQQFYHLNQRALTPAIQEINEMTDLNISYEEIYDAKKIVALKFHFAEKTKSKKQVEPKPEQPKQPKPERPQPEQPEKKDIYSDLASVFSVLGFEERAFENVANKLKSIKNISANKKMIADQLKILANYVLENSSLGAGFVIREVEKAAERFEKTGAFDFNNLTSNAKPRTYATKKPITEPVPEWFNNRQKKTFEAQPANEVSGEVDFEAERAKVLAKFQQQ